MIVIATPTIMDGTTIRWYTDEATVERHDPVASASRNKVEFYQDDVPAHVRDAAQAAGRELAKDRDADVRHYATHTKTLFGPLTPVNREA